jgi:hypothetical protein
MLSRRGYYLLKPFIPWSVRNAFRRLHAARRLASCSDVWPINEVAGQTPAGWRGWPNGKRFAVVLTHDVEGQRGLERCEPLMELEMRAGFRSSFNFIPEGGYSTPEQLRVLLTARGYEVGVHDLHHDGRLYGSLEGFRMKAARINGYLRDWNAVGFRSGFMHHNLEWLQDLDVLYDASTFDTDPFEPQPDGMNTIFPFYVNGTNGRKGFVELPYTLVQDSTLFLVLRAKDCEIWKRKTDWVAQRGGMVLVNVHPDYLYFGQGKPERATFNAAHYEALLVYIRDRYPGQFWAPLPKELAKWFRDEHCVKRAAQNG